MKPQITLVITTLALTACSSISPPIPHQHAHTSLSAVETSTVDNIDNTTAETAILTFLAGIDETLDIIEKENTSHTIKSTKDTTTEERLDRLYSNIDKQNNAFKQTLAHLRDQLLKVASPKAWAQLFIAD
ncbi:MAG: hypothetical protein RIG82_09270 [Phycisphaeraceae bacterium]